MRNRLLARLGLVSLTAAALFSATISASAASQRDDSAAMLVAQLPQLTMLPVVSEQQVLAEVPLTALRADGTTNAAEPSPAGCRFEYVTDAHIAGSVSNAVKVNSKIQCNRPVQALTDRTNLYKWHFFGTLPSLQRSTTTKNTGRAYLFNQDTFRHCDNHKSTQWFGTAQGLSSEGGKTYVGYAQSAHLRVQLSCGT